MAFDAEVIEEIRSVAAAERIEPAALLAVAEVESGGRAFTVVEGARRPVILYEYHVFYRNLPMAKRAEAVRRNLARRRWKELPYKRTQSARYAQFARASEIDSEAAAKACSWGVGQVLGENATAIGYPSAQALVAEAMSGVAGQVRVMLAFIRANRLEDDLSARDWRGFARIYNGAGQVEYYSGRLASAYRRHGGKGGPSRDDMLLRVGSKGPAVSELQTRLRQLGYYLIIDGDFGPATERMVRAFQREVGLTVDGIAGPRTFAGIEARLGRDALAVL